MTEQVVDRIKIRSVSDGARAGVATAPNAAAALGTPRPARAKQVSARCTFAHVDLGALQSNFRAISEFLANNSGSPKGEHYDRSVRGSPEGEHYDRSARVLA